MKISLKNIDRINNSNKDNYTNNNITNIDQILLKIREEYKIYILNDIKKQLFPINFIKENIKENSNTFKESTNEDDIDDENNKTNKKNYNQ
jgi:hypothetical protein